MHIYNEKTICVLITALLLNDKKTLTKENDFQTGHNILCRQTGTVKSMI